jgi:hypothetical protein
MKIYIGFDISTSNVGMCVFDEKGKILMLKHFVLKTSKEVPEDLRLFIKANGFEKSIIENKETLENMYGTEISGIYIEEPLIGSNNQFTASLLQKFNGMASLILYKVFNSNVEFISVHESRKLFCPEFVTKRVVKGEIKTTLSFPKDIDKKHYILEKISKHEPNVLWIYDKNGKIKKESYDLSDSVCVGYSKLIQKGIVNAY